MQRNFRNVLRVMLVAALALAAAGCKKLQARDMLNKGVQAYKAGQFDRSIDFFKQAKELDPTLLNARIYLGVAYSSQYIPGAPSEENTRKGEQAIEEFKEVLSLKQDNISAIDQLAGIYFNMAASPFDPAKFEESKKYHKMHIQLKPDDPEPYYSAAVINWTLAYRGNTQIRADYNRTARKQLKDDEPLPQKVREEYVAKYGELADEGITFLQKAMKLREDYEDAMAYLNLLYRRKADMVAAAEERDTYVKMADDLVDKVKEIKQKKMEAPPPKQ